MKLPELPKPDFMEGGRDWPLRGAWIECQMQAYGEACYRAAIEQLKTEANRYRYVRTEMRHTLSKDRNFSLKEVDTYVDQRIGAINV
jgi:hypothetical protein